ncbi:Transposase and inactivated derivatives [Moraxella caprae]|uniref:Transposase and inactivated derivatives n=1 Tax=Moraxella caprae TaxID=90240 RepID=A0A378QYX3_9GAMM|nr:helix-turn-helix domain-containing protein [Moraxella caprae]STZ08256.1 Transposase and inactivated derivatives [Moraxella caprae]STZ09261.1 Transposase and inactivated derivatives [Moraxella caprae]
MAKYTTDFKLSVIAHYQSNHSYKRTAKHFGLDHKTVELWVKLYQTHGIDGIQRRSTKAVYDTDFKLNAIKQLQNGKSLTQLSIELNLPTPSLLSNWLKSYQTFGIMGLEPKPKGRKAMSNKHNANQNKLTNKTTSKPSWQAKPDNEKSVDDLLAELAYLRAENDYLKKLDALIRQKEQLKNKS